MDRRQVYRAEDLSAECTILIVLQPVEELQSVVDLVLQSGWWNANFVGVPAPIAVSLNRSRLRSCWQPDARRISLSPANAHLSTLCHEMAHVAVTDFATCADGEQPDHGSHFRSLHVAIRQVVLGRRCGEDLASVYRQFGLALQPEVSKRAEADPWANPVVSSANYEAEWRTEPGANIQGSARLNAAGTIAL